MELEIGRTFDRVQNWSPFAKLQVGQESCGHYLKKSRHRKCRSFPVTPTTSWGRELDCWGQWVTKTFTVISNGAPFTNDTAPENADPSSQGLVCDSPIRCDCILLATGDWEGSHALHASFMQRRSCGIPQLFWVWWVWYLSTLFPVSAAISQG